MLWPLLSRLRTCRRALRCVEVGCCCARLSSARSAWSKNDVREMRDSEESRDASPGRMRATQHARVILISSTWHESTPAPMRIQLYVIEYDASSAGRERACVLGQSAVGLTLLLTPNSVATDECCASEV